MIERFNVTPPEELFEVQKVKIKFNESQMPGKLHTSEFCALCGDRVADGYHLIADGEIDSNKAIAALERSLGVDLIER